MSSAANSAECIHLPMNKLAAKIQNHFFQIKKKICAADQSQVYKKRKAIPKLPHKRGIIRLLFAKPVQTKICSVLTWFASLFLHFCIALGCKQKIDSVVCAMIFWSGFVGSSSRSLCKELIPGISKNQKTLAQISPRTQTDIGVFNKSSETVTMSRVTLIVWLPLRLTSFWIISSQISSKGLAPFTYTVKLWKSWGYWPSWESGSDQTWHKT